MEVITIGRKLENGISEFHNHWRYAQAFREFYDVATTLYPGETFGLLMSRFPMGEGDPALSLALMEKIDKRVDCPALQYTIGMAHLSNVHRLGICRRGISGDLPKAIKFIEKAANGGNEFAPKKLAILLQTDRPEEAYKWAVIHDIYHDDCYASAPDLPLEKKLEMCSAANEWMARKEAGPVMLRSEMVRVLERWVLQPAT